MLTVISTSLYLYWQGEHLASASVAEKRKAMLSAFLQGPKDALPIHYHCYNNHDWW